ncbi:MAG: hypothetical protein M3140_07760, partial [Actinomycetota bacterium]|nr:hypothetical protein [Actinomycetota bacterium]
LDLRAPLRPGRPPAAAVAALRERVPTVGPDRFLTPEIEAAVDLVASGRALAVADAAAGSIYPTDPAGR